MTAYETERETGQLIRRQAEHVAEIADAHACHPTGGTREALGDALLDLFAMAQRRGVMYRSVVCHDR